MSRYSEWEAVSRERERCAQVAEGQAEFVAGETHERLCHSIAKLIRAGGICPKCSGTRLVAVPGSMFRGDPVLLPCDECPVPALTSPVKP